MTESSISEYVKANFSEIMVNGEIEALEEFELELMNQQKKVGFWCVMGSRAFGVHRPDSDVDIRGFYCYSPEYWQGSLHQSAPETVRLTIGKIDVELQELSTFIRLLGRQNQNNLMVVAKLWSECGQNTYSKTGEFVLMSERVIGRTNGNTKSIHGQMRSDVFDLLRQDRSEKNIEKTIKNLIKLTFLRKAYKDGYWFSIFLPHFRDEYSRALSHLPSLTEKIMKIRQTTLITNSKDEEQIAAASEALINFWPDNLLDAHVNIMSDVAAGTRNAYSESGSGKLESNKVAEMKMNTEIRKMVWCK